MSTIRAFDAAIDAQLSQIKKLQQQLMALEAELRGMRRMRDLIVSGQSENKGNEQSLEPSRLSLPISVSPSSDGGYRGGRQPGAISQAWRGILSDLYWKSGNGSEKFGTAEILDAAKERGIDLRPSEARSRMEHYQQFGYTHVTSDGIVVTDEAARKFGFDQEPLTN